MWPLTWTRNDAFCESNQILNQRYFEIFCPVFSVSWQMELQLRQCLLSSIINIYNVHIIVNVFTQFYLIHVYTRIYTIGIIHICFILLQTVVQAVAKSMTMTAQQVVKDEYGAEVSFFIIFPCSSCIYLNMYILYIH